MNAHRNRRQLLTVGHSSHSIQQFIDLIHGANVEVIADVRSSPFSRFAPQFNARELRHAIVATGIQYVPLGRELGGRPAATAFYDDDGHVSYERLAASTTFLEGVERLAEGASQYRVAIMCSEEDPMDCHRRLLVGRVLAQHDFEVLHLRADGRLEEERIVADRELNEHPDRYRTSIFGSKEEQWRSIRSVLGSTPLPTSSRR